MKKPYTKPDAQAIEAPTTLLGGSGGIVSKKPLLLQDVKLETERKVWADLDLQKYTIKEEDASTGRAKSHDLWADE